MSSSDTNNLTHLTKEDDLNLEPKEFLSFEPQIVKIDPAEVEPEGSDAA